MVKFDMDNIDDVQKDIINDYFKLFKINSQHNAIPKGNSQYHDSNSLELYNNIENVVNELVKQFVSYGIDYNNKNFGSIYLTEIEDYGNKENPVIMNSLTRQYQSCHKLNKKIEKTNMRRLKIKLVDYFCEEINFIKMPYDVLSLEHIQCILKYNLSMPLRALNTYIPETNMFKSEILNTGKVYKIVENITRSILTNQFTSFKFKSLHRQLSHLSLHNRYMWKYQYKYIHDKRWLTTEGDDNYFMYLWAGKIGDGNHSFDYFPQCLYPLLCNARNKVILVYDTVYNKFTARVYFRIIQSSTQAYLWLENIECCPSILSRESDYEDKMKKIIIHHAKLRAKQLHVNLASPCYKIDYEKKNIDIILNKSDGILETSRFIHDQENWIQTEDENICLSCYIWNHENHDDETNENKKI